MALNLQRNRLEKITLKGFKSIRSLTDFEPQSSTVLIGPNGAGKSNFISFFRMMSWALSGKDQLPFYVGQQGGSRQFLHDGPDTTKGIKAEIGIRTPTGLSEYTFRLSHTTLDSLSYSDERYRFTPSERESEDNWTMLGAGHNDPELLKAAYHDETARIISTFLKKIVVYQFHDTSETSRIRGKWSAHDSRWLMEDGANVAPVLHRLKIHEPLYYRRIIDVLQLIFPFFSDFVLEPEYDYIMLKWRELNTREVFNVSQASDGFLRIVALITLLLQPAKDLPDTLVLDEPELGLHPSAINIVGELIAAAAIKTQMIAATQSILLIDCFSPEDIVVVERPRRESTFQRLNSDELEEWLASYSLSELWEKNVIGGRP